MELPEDFREFIALLNAHDVRYVVVGGYAVAYHGYPRFTGDMDFFVEPSIDNAHRMEQVMKAFGFAEQGLSAGDFARRDQVVQLGVVPHRIDIVTGIEAVRFDDAWKSRVQVDLGDVTVHMIALDLLLANKAAVNRAQDVADIQHLTHGDDAGRRDG